jgi:hypothetical protein
MLLCFSLLKACLRPAAKDLALGGPDTKKKTRKIMKIYYDTVSQDYTYPLSKEDVRFILNKTSVEIINKIKSIRFGCNQVTTQEGRTAQRGDRYDIRINFCLKNNTSYRLSDDKKYIEQIKSFGGIININSKHISWNISDAKIYGEFLLLHEIGHIAYPENIINNGFTDKSSKKEEKWCDTFAMEILKNKILL